MSIQNEKMISTRPPDRSSERAGAAYDVVGDGYPEIRRVCTGCGRMRALVCSGNFRVNANGKLIDIWLLYRCERCDSTYNFTIVERVAVNRIDRVVLEGAIANSKALARHYARDLGLMRRNRVQLERGDAWRLIPREVEVATEPRQFRCRVDPPLVLRADHLAAAVLGTSRTAVATGLRRGAIRFVAQRNPRALRLWSQVDFHVVTGVGTSDLAHAEGAPQASQPT